MTYEGSMKVWWIIVYMKHDKYYMYDAGNGEPKFFESLEDALKATSKLDVEEWEIYERVR